MAIEIKQQKKNNSPLVILIIIIVLIAIAFFIAKDFFRLKDFIQQPKPEEVLPSKTSSKINTATLDIEKIVNNSLFQNLISHIKWPLEPVPLGKTDIFRP